MSISSIANNMKKAVTVLVGAALFAGSLVAVAPASAAGVSGKQPAKTVELGARYDGDTPARVVVKDGWIYSLSSLTNSYYSGKEVTYLKRTKVSTFGTATAVILMGQSETDSSKSKSTVGDTVTKLYRPISMDVVGNSVFVLDTTSSESGRRLIQIDLTGTTDASADLTGTVVASTDANSGLSSDLTGYGNVRAIAAASETEIFIANTTKVFKVTKSGSTWSTDAGTTTGGYIWGLKLAADGKLVVASTASMYQESSAWSFKFFATSDLSTATSTATLAEDASNLARRDINDFTIDPANNDILFVQRNGAQIQRIVKGSNGSYGTPQFEAMGGTDSYTATSIVASTPSQQNGYQYYDATVTESTTGIQVGAGIGFGNYVCQVAGTCYFNAPTSSTVTAVNGSKVTFKTSSMLNGQGYTSVKLQIVTKMNYVTGLAYDATLGLVALDRGGNYDDAYGSRLITFKARSESPGAGSISIYGGHKTARVSFQQPGFAEDIESFNVYLFESATSAAAITAAAAHTNPGSSVCSWNRDGSGNGYIYGGQYQECTVLSGLNSGKYYAVAIKAVTVDGNEVWTSSTGASMVEDRATTVVLPTDPDPAASNVGPGYAHEGTTSTTASELVASGYKRLKTPDGRGGNYVGFQMGDSFKSPIKVIHILANGSIDATFGTNGILEPATQGLESTNEYDRKPGMAWFGNGKFLYLDRTSSTETYNVSFEGASQVQNWSISQSTGKALCAQAFPGALANTAYAGYISPVSAASADPVLEVGCTATYALAPNDYTHRTQLVEVPVYAKLTADDTLTLLASTLSGVTDYTSASAITNRCIENYSYQNHIVAKANPGSGEPLFTALLSEYAASNNYCDSWSATPTAFSIQVNADGTTQRATNGLPTSNNISVEAIWTTSSGNAYIEASVSMVKKLYRLNSSGVLDTNFGSAGSKTITPPSCAGSYRGATGVSETPTGDVYFNGLSWNNPVYGMTPTNTPVYPFAVLLEKGSSTADLGTVYLGATLSFSTVPELNNSYWNSFGVPLAGTSIDSNGNVSVYYYGGVAGLKSVKIDSFASALPAGDDYIECPPSPFENLSTAPPFFTEMFSLVQMTDGSIFGYNSATSGSDAGKGVIYNVGANGNVKAGTFTVTEPSTTVHGYGWAVALPGNKVLVGGGMSMNGPNRTIEIYDPSAAAGSRWTVLTGTAGATDLLANKMRRGAVAQLLGNGKVLVFGGYDMNAYSDGELVIIGGANASSVTEAFSDADAGSPFSNIISAGAGKWLLFGTNERATTSATAATKIYTEQSGELSAGPALGAGRMAPVVTSLSATKTLIAGDNTMMMGPNSPMTGKQTFDVYDSSNNKITTSTLRTGYFSSGFGALLPSGKVLLIQTQSNQNPAQSTVLDMTALSVTNGELMPNGLRLTKLFKFGEKVLLAGGRNTSGGSLPGWQVFTEPVAVAGALTVDARKVLKGTTGNINITAGVQMTIGSGATALSVQYANAAGSTVLKASPSALVTGSKLKLDATGRVLTAPLPTTAQINATATGAVVATVKQGTTVLGTVTINYVATKDVPVFSTQVAGNIPGMVANLPLAVSTNAGNGIPVLTYKSTTTKVCTVNAGGTVTRVSRGVCKVTVSQAADLGTEAKNQDFTLTFLKSTAVLSFGGATPVAGNIDLTEDDIQLELVATVDGAPAADLDVTYSVDNDDKCSVDEDGVFNTLATGSCTVTATFAGDANITGPVTTTRQFTIVTPSAENPGTVGGVIGDAVFEEKDDPEDTMLTVSMTALKHVKRTIKLGRGWKIVYTPTIKAKTTNVVTGATFLPTMTSAYIGTMTTTFLVAKSAFAKTPSGWKVVGTNYTCAMTYGSKTQVAANKKIKTVVTKGKTCALPALTAAVQVKVKNNWTRLAQKKGSPALTAQKRTAKINLQ